ncbi:MAG: hypothetical protein IKU52_06980 [Clostridia bacterium]|nr:hypothetical protein [Clostridia bacterium]
MMCMKDMLCEAKDKMYEAKDLVLDRRIDARMSIAKKGELDHPIKSVSMHRDCYTPLWKLLAIAMGMAAGSLALYFFMKNRSCNRNCD